MTLTVNPNFNPNPIPVKMHSLNLKDILTRPVHFEYFFFKCLGSIWAISTAHKE